MPTESTVPAKLVIRDEMVAGDALSPTDRAFFLEKIELSETGEAGGPVAAQ